MNFNAGPLIATSAANATAASCTGLGSSPNAVAAFPTTSAADFSSGSATGRTFVPSSIPDVFSAARSRSSFAAGVFS